VQKTLSLTIVNQADELPQVIRLTKAFLDPHNLDPKIVYAVELILEEALINVIDYGYDDDDEHEIMIQIRLDQNQVAIKLEDDGKKFNPLTIPRIDTSKQALERLEGGLGIHLVRNMMNSMAYNREKGRNIFEIWIFI
jgi:anti-sigma regulatory factor (Ser/Thr protein kinase)